MTQNVAGSSRTPSKAKLRLACQSGGWPAAVFALQACQNIKKNKLTTGVVQQEMPTACLFRRANGMIERNRVAFLTDPEDTDIELLHSLGPACHQGEYTLWRDWTSVHCLPSAGLWAGGGVLQRESVESVSLFVVYTVVLITYCTSYFVYHLSTSSTKMENRVEGCTTFYILFSTRWGRYNNQWYLSASCEVWFWQLRPRRPKVVGSLGICSRPNPLVPIPTVRRCCMYRLQ